MDWKALEAINISKSTEINLNLHDVSAGKVLSLILSQAGPGDLLTYYIDQNVVEITTRAIADQKMITVVYYVMDLLQPNDTFNGTIQNATAAGPRYRAAAEAVEAADRKFFPTAKTMRRKTTPWTPRPRR